MPTERERRSYAPPIPGAAVVPHPRLIELVERGRLRKKVARAVSRLIAVLDELDGDSEAEPSLGAGVVLYPTSHDQRLWAEGVTDDREQVDEDGDPLDDGEDDPSEREDAHD